MVTLFFGRLAGILGPLEESIGIIEVLVTVIRSNNCILIIGLIEPTVLSSFGMGKEVSLPDFNSSARFSVKAQTLNFD
jgi:hypothetical protein